MTLMCTVRKNINVPRLVHGTSMTTTNTHAHTNKHTTDTAILLPSLSPDTKLQNKA